MNLENFIEITKTKLLNKPSISRFTKLEDTLYKVTQGTLFIARDEEGIKEAIQRGAFGILSEFEPIVSDNEIAWIYSQNLDQTIAYLLRYKLLEIKPHSYYLSKVEFDILQSINKDTRLIFLNNDMINNYHQLTLTAQPSSILLSYDKEMIQNISPQVDALSSKVHNEFKLFPRGLFLSTLIFKDNYFADLHISSLFYNEIKRVLNFADREKIEYDLKEMKTQNHFSPIFISDTLKVMPFGSTQRVLIVESDSTLLKREYSYLQKNSQWASIKYLPKVKIEDVNDLKALNIEKFNFILIKANYNEVIKILRDFSQKEQSLLFGVKTEYE